VSGRARSVCRAIAAAAVERPAPGEPATMNVPTGSMPNGPRSRSDSPMATPSASWAAAPRPYSVGSARIAGARRAAADHRLGHPIDRERLVLRAGRAPDHGDLRLVVVDDGPTGRRVGAEDVTRHPEQGIAVFVGHPQHDAALDHRLKRGGHALAAVGGEGHGCRGRDRR
jgi:hypothetical protein